MPYTKFCNKCDSWKDIRDFHKDKYTSDGYTFHCKDCRNAHHAEYRVKTNYKKDQEYHKETRSIEHFRKKEYQKHTEWGRKNAKKLAKYEKIRRDNETLEERKYRLSRMRVAHYRRKYRARVYNLTSIHV